MKKSKVVLLIALITLMAFTMAACGSKTPLTKDQQVYAGKWVAKDGTYVTIYLDGGGDLKGSSTSVEGGSTTIQNGTLTIGLGPIKKTMNITAEPAQVDGVWVMELDGIQYTKQ